MSASPMSASRDPAQARPRRPRPAVMSVTDRAAERLRAILTEKGPSVAGLRVGVKNGGCAGMEYTMSWAEAASPYDEVVEDKGVRILVDAKAVMFLLGTVMDYKVEQLSAQFTFENPNQTSACGCGDSVAIAPRNPADFEEAGAS